MLVIVELITLFAVLNATIPGQSIPIEVTPTLVDESGAAIPTTATPALDATLLGSVIAIGAGLFTAYKKNVSRTNATADTSLNLVQSLKATDIGVKDIANNLASALQKLTEVSPQNAEALASCKETATQNAKEWNKDIKEYYENKPLPTSKDIGLDKVKTKLKEVNHMTQPTSTEESAASS